METKGGSNGDGRLINGVSAEKKDLLQTGTFRDWDFVMGGRS